MINYSIVYKKIIVVVLFLFFVTEVGFTQKCKSFLTEYSDKISKLDLPKGKKVYYLDLTVISKYESGYSVNEVKSDTKMFLSEKLMTYENEVMSVYKDGIDVFTVMHQQKKIIHTKPTNRNTDSLQNLMSGRQKFIIDNSEEVLCKDITINDNSFKYIVLKANENLSKRYNIDRVKYYYDKQKEYIYKSVIVFKKQAKLSEQTFVYNIFNIDYKGFKQRKAKDMIYDRNKKILKKYKNYKLVKNY